MANLSSGFGSSSSASTSYIIISSSSVVYSVDSDFLGLCLAIFISISGFRAFERFLLFFEFWFTFCGTLNVLESSLLGVVVADSDKGTDG
ncbi:UNVERIFIED_CONTAM: hypothetical protein NCL1_44226 [Trichonephila clavipes]